MKWTKEECTKEAQKYLYKKDFKKYSSGAYTSSIKNKWLDDITKHMISLRKSKDEWTLEECRDIAKKYKTRTEFNKKSISAYRISLSNDWIADVCSHMNCYGNRYLRCIYSYEFSDNSIYIGLTYNTDNRHKKHMFKGTVKEHMIKINENPKIKKLTEYLPINEAKNEEYKYVEFYKKNGWKILNKIKTGGVGGTSIIWNYENCKKESLKYKSRSEFAKNNGSAYYSSIKNKWLDDICSHMILKKKPNGYWNYENCKKEALRYKTKKFFYKNSKGAYNSAKRNKWLNNICEHMIGNKNIGYWNYENCKKEALKYKTKTEFKTKCGSGYFYSYKNKWLNDICEHMTKSD